MKLPGTCVRANLICDFTESAAFREIGINLPIPSGVVARADKCGELRQLFGRQGVHGVLNFGKAHCGSLSEFTEDGNATTSKWAVEIVIFDFVDSPLLRLLSGRLRQDFRKIEGINSLRVPSYFIMD